MVLWTLLDELSKWMKVCCKVRSCWEKSLAILTLALAVELLPPLWYIVKCWLKVSKDLDWLTLVVQYISYCCVLHSIWIVEVLCKTILSCWSCAFHKLIYISTAYCYWQKTNCCENWKTSSYIIRNYKCLIAFLCCKCLESSLCLVRCGVDSLCCALLAILLNKLLLEDSWSDTRLCCCTRLGDDVDREISVTDHLKQMSHVCAADVWSCIVDLRSLTDWLVNWIIKAVS